MADTNFVITATDKTRAAFSSVEKGLGGLHSKALAIGTAIAGLAGAAGFGALVKMSGDAADKLAKASDITGVTTQKLAGLQYAVEQTSDVSGEQFVTSLSKMNQKIAEAAIKGGETGDAIKRMGLNVQQLAGMSADKQFAAISEAMNGVANSGERAFLAQKLMEEQGVKLLTTMRLGKDGLADYTSEAEAFGIAISRADAAKIEESNDAMDRLGRAVMGIATTIRVQLSPYIAAIANHFSDAAREANGFKDETVTGMEKATNAVAFLADMWRGLSVVWKGLETIFWGFTAATLTGIEHLNIALAKFIDAVPGLEAKPDPTLAEWAETARQKTIDAQTALADLALQPMPSDGIKQFFAEVRAEAEASAQKVAEAAGAMATGGGIDNTAADTKAAEAAEKHREQLAQRLARVSESLLSENERMALHYQEQEFIVEEAFQLGIVSQQERYALLEEMELQHQAKMGDLEAQGLMQRRAYEAQSYRERSKTVLGEIAGLTAGVAQHNKTLFEVNKIAGIANAIISTYEGVTLTMSKYPYPLNIGMAAAHMAAGMAQVAAIKSTSFAGGGAGTTPSMAGSAPTVNDIPVAAGSTQTQQPIRRIEVQIDDNALITGTTMRQIIESINEELADGMTMNASVA